MPQYRTHAAVTLDTARRAVCAVLAESERRGLALTVAVVDPSLQLVAFANADGAPRNAESMSRRKATTAATMGRASSTVPDDLVRKLQSVTADIFTNIGGGVPLVFGGQLVGAIGVTGSDPGTDAEVAQQVLVALGADRL